MGKLKAQPLKRHLIYLVRVESWRSSGAAVFDAGFDPHEEVDVAEVFRVAEVKVVLDVDAGRQRRAFKFKSTFSLEVLTLK